MGSERRLNEASENMAVKLRYMELFCHFHEHRAENGCTIKCKGEMRRLLNKSGHDESESYGRSLAALSEQTCKDTLTGNKGKKACTMQMNRSEVPTICDKTKITSRQVWFSSKKTRAGPILYGLATEEANGHNAWESEGESQ